jgi:hypothetical protein
MKPGFPAAQGCAAKIDDAQEKQTGTTMAKTRRKLSPAAKNREGHGAANTRLHLASEAARILCQEGVRSYRAAKLKAAERLGMKQQAQNLPGNDEVERALIDYLQLFHGDEYRETNTKLLKHALDAMQFLQDFEPRLTGSVATGAAHRYSDVNLHVFSDTVEEVALRFFNNKIPMEQGSRPFSFNRDSKQEFPTILIEAEGIETEIVVFPRIRLRQAPLSHIDQQPMPRLSMDAVKERLNSL